MRGPKIKPDELKKLQGTFQPCHARPNALKVKDLVNIPDPPDHIQGFAREIYFDTGAKLLTRGVLNSINLTLFISLCFVLGTINKMEIDIAGAGDIDTMAKLMRIYNDTLRNAKSLCAEYGITPASAMKVHVKEKEKFNIDSYLGRDEK